MTVVDSHEGAFGLYVDGTLRMAGFFDDRILRPDLVAGLCIEHGVTEVRHVYCEPSWLDDAGKFPPSLRGVEMSNERTQPPKRPRRRPAMLYPQTLADPD